MPAPEVGVFLPSMSVPGEPPGDMVRAARHAEELGLESVWVIDQLVAGTGVPFLDSGIALTAAAAATTRVTLGYGVAILPLHPVVWLAKQVASLQRVSGGRVVLGVGAGGDRHERSWAAAGAPRRERGRRTDAALRALPGLIAGKPARLEDMPGHPEVQLAPGVPVPPIVVGGMSDAALVRAVDHDGWFQFPLPPAAVAQSRPQIAELAAARGRPTPAITASLMIAVTEDPGLPDPDTLRRRISDPDGMFGIPDELVDATVMRSGRAELAERLAAYADAGAQRVVLTVAGGDWYRQVELAAEARSLLT